MINLFFIIVTLIMSIVVTVVWTATRYVDCLFLYFYFCYFCFSIIIIMLSMFDDTVLSPYWRTCDAVRDDVIIGVLEN